ncbi:PIN domain-like protein, partial [Mycena floridula]
LQPTAKEISLDTLALKEGFELDRHGRRSLVIGIDVSGWFSQAQHVFAHKARFQAGPNPELKILFYHLCHLSKLPIIPVFVLDGDQRPAQKRGQSWVKVAHWLVANFKDMALAFGYHVHQAPAEAEAELAYLNNIGAVDLVITEDVNALMYGAKYVL